MRPYPGLIRRSFVVATLLLSAQALDAVHSLRAMEVEVTATLDPQTERMRDTTKCATDSECEEARVEQCIGDIDLALPDDQYSDSVDECAEGAQQ
jgi:hypothetical protein